jgi:acyl dehydratase
MSEHELHFDQLPSLGAFYRKALLSRKPGLATGEAIPEIRANVSPLVPASDHVALYRRVCGLRDHGVLPHCYPHVLAAPLHFAILMSEAFPFKALGLVHVSNQILVHRPLAPDEKLEVKTWVVGQRDAPRGLLFDLKTRIFVGNEVVWESISTIIRIEKGKGKGERRERVAPQPGLPPGVHRTAVWRIGEDAGRRYAKPSGDYNPIHIHPLLAKMFGFKRAIVHGMWSFARCVAECESELPDGPILLDVAFKRPIFLPSRVLFSSYKEEKGVRFGLHSREGTKPHTLGSARLFSGADSFL